MMLKFEQVDLFRPEEVHPLQAQPPLSSCAYLKISLQLPRQCLYRTDNKRN